MIDQVVLIAQVLAKHEPNGDAEWCTGDGCTYSFAEALPENTGTYWEAFAHHLAESVAAAQLRRGNSPGRPHATPTDREPTPRTRRSHDLERHSH